MQIHCAPVTQGAWPPIPSLPREAPRLCRGGSRSLTNSGVHRRKLPTVSRQAHERENHDGQVRKPKPHGVGVQIPRRVHTEMPATDAVRRTAQVPWRGFPKAGGTERKSNRGRASDAGPRAYNDRDSAEVCRVAGGWVHQGQERHPFGAGLCGAEAKLRRAACLGKRILCIDGGSGRSRNTGLHPTPKRRGQATGANEPVEVTGHRYGGPKNSGPRQRPRTTALSGSQSKAPGFAGGYLPES
jgi:hypothetical protein